MNDADVPVWDVLFVQQAIRSLRVIIDEVSVIVGQQGEAYSGGGHTFDSFDASDLKTIGGLIPAVSKIFSAT